MKSKKKETSTKERTMKPSRFIVLGYNYHCFHQTLKAALKDIEGRQDWKIFTFENLELIYKGKGN